MEDAAKNIKEAILLYLEPVERQLPKNDLPTPVSIQILKDIYPVVEELGGRGP